MSYRLGSIIVQFGVLLIATIAAMSGVFALLNIPDDLFVYAGIFLGLVVLVLFGHFATRIVCQFIDFLDDEATKELFK